MHQDLAVAARVAHDPDSGNPVRASLGADRYGELLGLRDLSPRAAHSGVYLAEGVPALLDEQDSQRVVAYADINRETSVRRPGREFEGSMPAGQPAKPERQFLDTEVSGVLRLLDPVACIVRPKGHVERLPQREPDLQRHTAAVAAFDLSDAAAQPDLGAQLAPAPA